MGKPANLKQKKKKKKYTPWKTCQFCKTYRCEADKMFNHEYNCEKNPRFANNIGGPAPAAGGGAPVAGGGAPVAG
ncbi:hypothetical protein Tco_0565527 [Tanacetum coccineum]